MFFRQKKIVLADDDKETVGFLFKMRLPSLIVGLFLGMALSFFTSRFEEVLSKNVSVAFFIPLVVYLADAVGTQTQSIYTRALKDGKANFKGYLFKEWLLGIFFGIVFSLLSALIIFLWFKSVPLTWAVSLAMFSAVSSAPIVALIVTEGLQLERKDPAVGAGPIATVIQDTASVCIYGIIASLILL